MFNIKDNDALWCCSLSMIAVISASLLAHFMPLRILMSLVFIPSRTFSSSEKVITQSLIIITVWSILSKAALDLSVCSLPKRKDCKCDRVPLISLTSVRIWRAWAEAPLLDLINYISSVEICAAAVRIPITPAAILSGSDI